MRAHARIPPVYGAGSGANYTLGTGSTDLQEHPARLESLHDQQVWQPSSRG